MTKVINIETGKKKLIKNEIEKIGFSQAEMEELFEKENELNRKVQFYLTNLPEYNELIYVRDLIKHKSKFKYEYSTVVEKLSIEEQRKIMNKALKDIALNNIDECLTYNGDEERYLEFVNRVHGLKDEWKAFRRTNVNNFNYYLAKAKFMLDTYSYNYAILLVDAYKDYKRYLTLDDRAHFIKGIGATILQKDIDELGHIIPNADKMLKKLKSKTDRELKQREALEHIYKKNRYRNINYDEFIFRLDCYRILHEASNIPELSEYAALIHYRYFIGASIIESSRFVLDFDELISNRINEFKKDEQKSKDQGIEGQEPKYTTNEFLQKIDKYFESEKNRGSVNNMIRKLEHALAEYLIAREKDYISGLEYFKKFEQAKKDLDNKELMIEFAKTMERYKEVSESLKNMNTKLPRKKKDNKGH